MQSQIFKLKDPYLYKMNEKKLKYTYIENSPKKNPRPLPQISIFQTKNYQQKKEYYHQLRKQNRKPYLSDYQHQSQNNPFKDLRKNFESTIINFNDIYLLNPSYAATQQSTFKDFTKPYPQKQKKVRIKTPFFLNDKMGESYPIKSLQPEKLSRPTVQILVQNDQHKNKSSNYVLQRESKPQESMINILNAYKFKMNKKLQIPLKRQKHDLKDIIHKNRIALMPSGLDIQSPIQSPKKKDPPMTQVDYIEIFKRMVGNDHAAKDEDVQMQKKIENISYSRKMERVVMNDSLEDKKKRVIIALKTVLYFLKKLNLDLDEVLTGEIFSKEPYDKPNSFQFFTAVKLGDIDAVDDFLFNDKYLVYAYDDFCLTPLHWAVKKNQFALVKLLLKHNSHIDSRDLVNNFMQIGRTPLYIAVQEGLYIIAFYLLNQKASPWSFGTTDYNKIIKNREEFRALFSQFKQIYICMTMMSYKMKQEYWQIQSDKFRTKIINMVAEQELEQDKNF